MSDINNNRELVEQSINESDAGVYAYDIAIVQDLRARFKQPPIKQSDVNQTVQIGSANNMFDIIGQLNDDQVIMPFVSLQRINWQLNLDRQGYQTFIGDRVYTRLSNENQSVEIRAQVIPITINYQLSVWTKDRITNDALMSELLFYYHLRPSLLVHVGYGLNLAHKFNIYFNSEVEDNSDIANHNVNGTYFRQDINFYTDDAYLWRANHIDKVSVSPGLYFYYEDDSGNPNLIEDGTFKIDT